MGVVDALKDWVHFRSMITPIILKVLYQLLFLILNVGGLIVLIAAPIMALMQDSGAAGIIAALAGFIVILLLLIIYNILLRVYFELILLMFNVYDELKVINRNTRKEAVAAPQETPVVPAKPKKAKS